MDHRRPICIYRTTKLYPPVALVVIVVAASVVGVAMLLELGVVNAACEWSQAPGGKRARKKSFSEKKEKLYSLSLSLGCLGERKTSNTEAH